jgi:glycerol uptake operon antiterminator
MTMAFGGQRVIPAAKTVKDFEALLASPYSYIILLQSHIAQLQPLFQLARKQDKRVLLHADLIQGLKHDEAAAQFLCQYIQPYGLISTHSAVLSVAKKHDILAIQRVFLLDSQSLETSLRVLASSTPDYVEVIPGAMPHVIAEVKSRAKVPLLAGGFLRTRADVEQALAAGATAVTTSQRQLWELAYSAARVQES